MAIYILSYSNRAQLGIVARIFTKPGSLAHIYSMFHDIYVTESGKTGLIHTSTEIQFLSISERYTHALPRNTKYLAIDGQVCFYRRLFADAVKPRRCISWSWGALIGLHGVPNCSSRQSGPPLWIVPIQVTY